MSKTKAIGIVAVFAAFTASQALAEGEEAKTEKVCEDLASAKVAFQDVDNLSSTSTVEEAKTSVKAADKAMNNLAKSAKKARPEQYKELEQAHKQLRKTIEDAPKQKDATLGQVRANIEADKQRVRDAYNDLTQSISCPQPG